MRVSIVGAGAMGTLLGHGFCRGGHQVSILDLPDRVSQLQSTGKLVVVATDAASQ
jgi:ketopantoate reductase